MRNLGTLALESGALTHIFFCFLNSLFISLFQSFPHPSYSQVFFSTYSTKHIIGFLGHNYWLGCINLIFCAHLLLYFQVSTSIAVWISQTFSTPSPKLNFPSLSHFFSHVYCLKTSSFANMLSIKIYCFFVAFQFSSVQSPSRVWLFVTPWTAAHQASLSIINSWNLFKLISTELVMPLNHLILCYPHFLRPSIFPSIRVFSNESALHIKSPKY